MKNAHMDRDCFKLRREVMQHVYHAKRLLRPLSIELPRITVRITEFTRHDSGCLGVASLGDSVIWIPSTTITDGEYDLRSIVLHEILHAAFSVGHVADCPMMGAYALVKVGGYTPALDQLFVDYCVNSRAI